MRTSKPRLTEKVMRGLIGMATVLDCGDIYLDMTGNRRETLLETKSYKEIKDVEDAIRAIEWIWDMARFRDGDS